MKFQLLFSVAVVWCHVFAYRLEKTNSMYYIWQIFFFGGVSPLRVFFSLLALTNPSGCLFEKFGTWSSRRWSAVYVAKYKNTATAFFAQAHSKNSPLKQISRLVVFRFFQCKTSFTFKLNLLVSISPLFFALFFSRSTIPSIPSDDFCLLLRMKRNLT